MQIKKSTKTVTASDNDTKADFMRKVLVDEKGYSEDQVNSMGLRELKAAFVREGCDESKLYGCDEVKASSSDKATTSNNDKAIQHIKAAIDILASDAKTNEVARDSIANLGVVMFDLLGE